MAETTIPSTVNSSAPAAPVSNGPVSAPSPTPVITNSDVATSSAAPPVARSSSNRNGDEHRIEDTSLMDELVAEVAGKPSAVKPQPANSDNPTNLKQNKVEEPKLENPVIDPKLAARMEALIGKKPDPSKQEDKGVQQQQGNDKPAVKRDYSGIPADLAAVMPAMSNEAFNKIAPVIREVENIKAEKEAILAREAKLQQQLAAQQGTAQSFYDDPNAYVLTQEFQTYKQNYEIAGQHLTHWQEQLANIQAGKDWTDLRINPATRQYEAIVRKADPAGYSQVITNLTRAQNQVDGIENQLRNASVQHQQSYQKRVEGLKQVVNERFPQYHNVDKDPELKKKYDGMADLLTSAGVAPNNPAHILLVPLALAYVEAISILQALAASDQRSTKIAAIDKVENVATTGGVGKQSSASSHDDVENILDNMAKGRMGLA